MLQEWGCPCRGGVALLPEQCLTQPPVEVYQQALCLAQHGVQVHRHHSAGFRVPQCPSVRGGLEPA